MDTHTPTKELVWGLFSNFKAFLGRYKKAIILAIWLIMILSACRGIYVAVDNRITHKHQAVEIMRDSIVAVMANRQKDSTPISELEIDYLRAGEYNLELTWGIHTNSIWLGDATRLIIPYMSYELVNLAPNYPDFVIFMPQMADSSFHLMGQAGRSFMWGNIVTLNERMLWQDGWDAERLWSTMVHEFVHIQNGSFRNGASEDLESATVAATLEILAGMCNHNHELSCSAFWAEVEDLAKYSLRTKLHRNGLDWWYEFFCNVFLRDKDERSRVDKANRHWERDQAYLWEIIKKYGAKPWLDHVVPGVQGKGLETGHYDAVTLPCGCRVFRMTKLYMPFDDTIKMFGPMNYVIRFFEVFRSEYWYPEL